MFARSVNSLGARLFLWTRTEAEDWSHLGLRDAQNRAHGDCSSDAAPRPTSQNASRGQVDGQCSGRVLETRDLDDVIVQMWREMIAGSYGSTRGGQPAVLGRDAAWK